jgi:GTPase involved in cell partitioning and DNA repair
MTSFIDRVQIKVSGGDGGSGISSFRREKFIPLGGPDGGDGGRGGDVYVRGDYNLATLLDYTYRDKWAAERGDHGSGNNKTGRSGADIVLPVPPGTIVRDVDSGETAIRFSSPRAVVEERVTRSSPPQRTNHRGSGSPARKVCRARWSWCSSSSRTLGSWGSRTPASPRCSR